MKPEQLQLLNQQELSMLALLLSPLLVLLLKLFVLEPLLLPLLLV
jgi:hypothetical protein|uniref:Uncharacterized protein n=1 Tax=Picea glauca TaxID=3330 RepID=A0A101LZZ8_PICGL|nr:hypothetical protein ABT39_MTgene4462 [Picea glauca]QHR91333.1 hypothetical protein Q903MT_gene5365 [Picea sitchensis]